MTASARAVIAAPSTLVSGAVRRALEGLSLEGQPLEPVGVASRLRCGVARLRRRAARR